MDSSKSCRSVVSPTRDFSSSSEQYRVVSVDDRTVHAPATASAAVPVPTHR
jgi:hypothetical protein